MSLWSAKCAHPTNMAPNLLCFRNYYPPEEAFLPLVALWGCVDGWRTFGAVFAEEGTMSCVYRFNCFPEFLFALIVTGDHNDHFGIFTSIATKCLVAPASQP